MYNIIGKRIWWYGVSAVLIVSSIVMIAIGGLKLGIDFTGGSLIRVSFSDVRPQPQEILDQLAPLGLGGIQVQPLATHDASIRMKELSQEEYQRVLDSLSEKFSGTTAQSFESIGPTIGKELRDKAGMAIILVLSFILLYITFAFRKSGNKMVSSWMYGFGVLIALFHDVIIVLGLFAFLGKFFNVEIDILFITAVLTVLGFSVHDSIVVYDRTRENLKTHGHRPFAEIVNLSVNQTLVRSLNTSLTTLLVLVALYFFGGDSIRFFILALILGIIVGTYSSIFIGSPFLVDWYKFRRRS
ncbi:MAG: protein translocase subunit SecF [Candidatus Kerfeldbacteria bacterium]|nr:protein translocase subunit SecF [Candidatus Kerfeldbacteria bacterium]